MGRQHQTQQRHARRRADDLRGRQRAPHVTLGRAVQRAAAGAARDRAREARRREAQVGGAARPPMPADASSSTSRASAAAALYVLSRHRLQRPHLDSEDLSAAGDFLFTVGALKVTRRRTAAPTRSCPATSVDRLRAAGRRRSSTWVTQGAHRRRRRHSLRPARARSGAQLRPERQEPHGRHHQVQQRHHATGEYSLRGRQRAAARHADRWHQRRSRWSACASPPRERLADGIASGAPAHHRRRRQGRSSTSPGLGSGRIYFLTARRYRRHGELATISRAPGDFTFKVGHAAGDGGQRRRRHAARGHCRVAGEGAPAPTAR